MTIKEKIPHYPLFINGDFIEGEKKETLESINPHTGKVWATFAAAKDVDVDRAISIARKSMEKGEWADMLPSVRGKLLFSLADLIEKHASFLGEIETKDSGKLLVETATQTKYVADYYRYYAGLADKIEGATLPIDKPDMHVFTTCEPIGVVAAIVPWNAQMFLTATKLAPALAAGCAIIIKASEIAPCTLLYFGKLIKEAGFPDGVVSIITGDAKSCAVPLTTHPDIDRIAFTGGPETAKQIIINSAENFAVTTLELGGKSPIIIFEDADIDSAVNGIIAGNYGASGQSCVAGSRVIVQESIKKDVIARLIKKINHIKVGSPIDPETHVGPLCTEKQIILIEDTLKKATSQGAKIHFGGKRKESEGYYFEPTLVDCPNESIVTLEVEMFGPVMSMLSFVGEEEAIELANNSQYGLGSGVFTNNLARAHRVSKKIKAGICWINSYRAISPIAPFGGYNRSGYAREAGIQAINDYVRTKTTWINISDAPMANPFVMR
jgi:aldehyde dehydrogenase (NAD+)